MHLPDLIPNVIIDNEYTFKNIFFKFNLKELIDEKYLQVYNIKDGDLLETISYKVYGDTRYFWTIMIVNNITDPIFDIAIPDDAIQRMARDKASLSGVIDYTLYSQIYDELSEENDLKREIKIIKPDYLGSFLTEISRVAEENI